MENNFLDFKKRQIRSYFFHLQKKEVNEAKFKIPITYIQMRLPVEKITPQFEQAVQKQIDSNYLHVLIREAKKEDLEHVLYIYNKAWQKLDDPHGQMTLEALQKIHAFPEITIFIASIYGMDVGFIMLDNEKDESGNPIGIIAGLGILPKFQTKGIGKVLGMTAWKYFKDKGIKELRCEVFIENKKSYKFIKSLGFEEFKTKIYKIEDFNLHQNNSG